MVGDERAAGAPAAEERAKDVRAAEAIGWIVEYGRYAPRDLVTTDPRDDNDVWRPLPAFGSDANAARQLVAAVPEEARKRFVRAIMNKVIPVAWAHEGPLYKFDSEEVLALLLATPRQLRDAVLEAVEGNDVV